MNSKVSARYFILPMGIILAVGIILLAWYQRNHILLILGLVPLALALMIVVQPIRAWSTVFLSLLVGLTGAELALSLAKPATLTVEGSNLTSTGPFYEDHDGLGWIPRPGIYAHRATTSEGELVFNTKYTIGADGFRESPGWSEFPVSLLGGSFTFGYGLGDSETVSFFLHEEHGISSKNYGINGYGAHHALYLLQHGNGSSDGVNVLLTAPWHAIRSSCKMSPSGPGSPFYVISGGGVKQDGSCPGNQSLARVANRFELYGLARRALVDDYLIHDQDIERYLKIVEEIAIETRADGSRLVIGFIKAPEDQLAGSSRTNEEIFSELAMIADVAVDVTLAPSAEEIPSEMEIHQFDTHPSSEANRQRAKLLASEISPLLLEYQKTEETGLIDRP